MISLAAKTIVLVSGAILIFGGSAWGQQIDLRKQCEKIAKGETASDRSYQPIYGPCCKNASAMASQDAMEKCVGKRALDLMGKMGAIK